MGKKSNNLSIREEHPSKPPPKPNTPN